MKNKFLILFIATLAVGLGAGCAAYEGGPVQPQQNGAVSYGGGTAKCTVDTPYEIAVDATLVSLKDLNYAVVDRMGDGITFKIIARSAGDHKITVIIVKDSGNVSDISVHVDTFGNEELSRTVISAIKSHL